MLDVLRKNSRHWLVTIIIAVVIVGLTAFFGSAARNSMGGAGWAAKIDGEPIKLADFLNRYSVVVENYRQKLGANFNDKIIKALNIKMQVLKGMVSQKIIAKEAYNNGFGVSNTELVDKISKIPAFQKDGKFNMDYYKGVLSYNRMKPADFEEMQRDDITRDKLRDIISSSAKVSEAELIAAYKMDNDKIKLSFVAVEKSDSNIEVKKDDIKAFLATEAGKKAAEDVYTKRNDSFKKGKQIIKFEDAKEGIARELLLKKKTEEVFGTKISEAVNAGDMNKAAKILNMKVKDTDFFTRKAPSMSRDIASSSNTDVLWAFNLVKGKISRRDIAGKTYLFAVKEQKGSKPDKNLDSYKQGFLSGRGEAEFRSYIDNLDKAWSKKVVFSPALMQDVREE